MNAVQAIPRWNPEDPVFWKNRGRRVATRNAWISGAALVVAYAVWMLWPALVAWLPGAGFHFSVNQLFWLAAAPALSGATLRLFFAFGVPAFGGRRWTTMTMAGLMLPVLGTGLALQDLSTRYESLLALALLCGLGGASFASTMAHISSLYPSERVGTPLGLNAGLGNLGLAVVHGLVPLALAHGLVGTPLAGPGGMPLWLGDAALAWLPLVALAALAAWFGMDDLAQLRSGFAEQAVIVLRKHNWLMSWLYLGSFGSFLGFTAAFPLLLSSQYPGLDAMAMAWAGPLAGAAMRPLGGWLSDRHGGARVTLWCFGAMVLATLLVIAGLPAAGGHAGSFIAGFAGLFAATGIACGSTFRMIPRIFVRTVAPSNELTPTELARARHAGHVEAGAALGFCSALGAYGGFVIPKVLGSSLAWTGTAEAALWLFLAFYVSCLAITWWHYARRFAPMPC